MNTTKCTLSLLSIFMLSGCEQSDNPVDTAETRVSPPEMKGFISTIKSNLVFVESGEFLMGDFGLQYGSEGLPYDADKDSKPLHKVKLSSYSIDKFKVTNEEYQIYLKYNGLQLREVGKGNQKDWKDISMAPNVPAHMDWYEAEQYCIWLAKVTDLPFTLPTEAQWEYAARSRGQFLAVATDDGTYKATRVPATEDDGPRGINISSSWDRETFAKEMGWKTDTLTPLPVDRFPPNPLGLYSMSDNGLEWVKDWYDPEYYKYSPVNDPQGPDKPMSKDYFGRDTKVARGQGFANPAWGGAVNVHRTAAEPHGYKDNGDMVFLRSKTARCVVNSPVSVN